jgi:hypothetical protein
MRNVSRGNNSSETMGDESSAGCSSQSSSQSNAASMILTRSAATVKTAPKPVKTEKQEKRAAYDMRRYDRMKEEGKTKGPTKKQLRRQYDEARYEPKTKKM